MMIEPNSEFPALFERRVTVTHSISAYPPGPPHECVEVRIDNLQSVAIALQLVAQQIPVALVLPGQCAPGWRRIGLDARPLALDAPLCAAELLAVQTELSITDFLDAAAAIFGVAQWPTFVGSLGFRSLWRSIDNKLA